MAPLSQSQKKRKIEDGVRGRTSRPKKRIRKQKQYHSSSEDEDGSDADVGFAPVNLLDSDEEAPIEKTSSKPKLQSKPQARLEQKKKQLRSTLESERSERPATKGAENSEGETSGLEGNDDSSLEASDSDSDAEGDSLENERTQKKKSKRNDPSAFSTSISKILNTKLPTSSRSDPVLSRSREAAAASASQSESRLEARARAKLRADKKEALDRNRTTDVLGIERGIAGQVAEEEKRLRKLATKGVIQLFNAFHAAHVRAEEALKEERRKGTVGMGNREEKRREMSKQGFLELIGGAKKETNEVNATTMEED